MKTLYSQIKYWVIFVTIVATTNVAWAQNITPDKMLADIESMSRAQAISEMTKWLDATAQVGCKEYKNLIASLEEMLSEPTWDYHNEELFALLMEHAATASCLNNNERMRPQMMLEVTRKNAPGSVAHNIEYETLDGAKGSLSEISTPYTLIYFNDPECLSCAKVKERLDTCRTLKQMVSDSTLTVIGIYTYDNVKEWHLEPCPDYIINGWDYKQEIEVQQTYDLMTMPMFYLLDHEKRVVLKNEPSLNRVIKVVNALKEMEYSDIEAKLNVVFGLMRNTNLH